jgi:hypothetical protein
MEKLEWPRPPVLLGLVLGPLAENRLFLSSDNYGMSWLTRPAVIGIFIVTFIGVVYPILKKRREAKAIQSTTTSAKERDEITPPTHPAGLNWKPIFSGIVIVLLALALWQSRNFGFRAGLFPWVIATPTLLLALCQLAKDLWGHETPRAAGPLGGGVAEVPREVANRRTLVIIGWILGFFFAIWFLGFSIAAALTMIVYLKVAGREKWPITIIMAGCAWLFFYIVFERGLAVPFPDGLIFSLFKSS